MGRSTTILGVKEAADACSGLFDVGKIPLLDVDGGGERTRGRFEADWLLFARAVLITFCGLTGSVAGSDWVVEGCNWGAPATERARWIAAADGTAGTIGPGRAGPRLGLKSVLFLRERGYPELADTPERRGGRTGEVSREGLGELVEEVLGTSDVVEALFKMRGVDIAGVEASFALTSGLLFPCSSSLFSWEWEAADAMIQPAG